MGPKEYEQAALKAMDSGGVASAMVYATLSVASALRMQDRP